MLCRFSLRDRLLPAALGCLLAVSTAMAQNVGGGPQSGGAAPGGYHTPAQPQSQPRPRPATESKRQPRYRVADRIPPAKTLSQALLTQRRPNEHPLMPALRWAQAGKLDIKQIQDYSATLVKRERVNAELNGYQYMFIKIRHNPFSVYICFLAPDKLKGQEVIYIEGKNDGKMWAHGTGFQKVFGTLKLAPTGPIAMRGNRYPLTEIGILNLVQRLIEIGDRDTQYGECEVKFIPGAKIEDRVATCIQVVHPVPRRNFLFHVARIYVDEELNVPVRYEAYDWPEQEGGRPQLTEEYTYLNLQLNNGFTDADFDTRNPNYQFTKK